MSISEEERNMLENKLLHPFTDEERAKLIDQIFSDYLSSDDPKYDSNNQEWLNSLNDAELFRTFTENEKNKA